MSVQLKLPGFEGRPSENRLTAAAFRAGIAREMRYLLTISRDAGKPTAIRPAGVAHSLGVCLIEDFNMSRGKGQAKDVKGAGMPRFVDVRLTAGQRDGFATWEVRESSDLVTLLQSLADDGYRVGVTWSGEHQAYTVSLTGRKPGGVNEGLCMTSFARGLETALWSAIYKHVIVAEGDWLSVGGVDQGDFG